MGLNGLGRVIGMVADYITSVFMKSFYENMLGGESARGSLLAARRELMGRGYDDPYYWAGFMVLE